MTSRKHKAADIFSLHEQFMQLYDSEFDKHPVDIKNLPNHVEHLLTNLPDEDFKEILKDKTKLEKLKKAVQATYAVISEKLSPLESFSSNEEYTQTIREHFDAAFRVELYRQFLARGQNYDKLRNNYLIFLRSQEYYKESQEVHTSDILNFLIERLKSDLQSQFSAFKKINSNLSAIDQGIVFDMEHDLNVLINEFNKSIITPKLILESMKREGGIKNEHGKISSTETQKSQDAQIRIVQNAALDFQIKAGQLIRKYQIKTKSDESWKPFLKNILLLITVFGTIPAAFSLAAKATTGKYIFFDKQFIKETPENERAPEDQLLGKSNPRK